MNRSPPRPQSLPFDADDGDQTLNTNNKMGYEMSVAIKVTPHERFDEIADAIEERFGQCFDNHGEGQWSWENNGPTRWSEMSQDLTGLSNNFPGVLIEVLGEGEDGQEWSEYVKGGKWYAVARPNFAPPAFNPSLLGYVNDPAGNTYIAKGADPEDPKSEEERIAEERFRQAAIDQFRREGDLEIDPDATVSISEDGGAYVQCWKWVKI